MDTQQHVCYNLRKRVTAVFLKTQRVLLKRRGREANLEIAFSDDSFSDRNP